MAMQYSNRIITLEAAYEQILVKADRSRLKQVLINLIDNAIKYPDSHLAIALILDLKAESALIHVCDRSLGIPLPPPILLV
jgi:K+-sensing histidine kinase KdpD